MWTLTGMALAGYGKGRAQGPLMPAEKVLIAAAMLSLAEVFFLSLWMACRAARRTRASHAVVLFIMALCCVLMSDRPLLLDRDP